MEPVPDLTGIQGTATQSQTGPLPALQLHHLTAATAAVAAAAADWKELRKKKMDKWTGGSAFS